MRAALPFHAFFRSCAGHVARCRHSVAKLVSVLALGWTNGFDVRAESVPVEDFAVLGTQSAHARICPVDARRGTAKNRQYQTVRGSPMWACWSRHKDARSRAPHPYSVCGAAGFVLTARCSFADPGHPPLKQPAWARQYSTASPSRLTLLSAESFVTPAYWTRTGPRT
jgi:hypothetical protein